MPLPDTMTLARPGPQSHLPRAAEKPASQGPTHDCPPASVAWAAQSPPAALGDPRAGSRKLSPSAPSALQGTRTHRRYRDKTRWFLRVASSHGDGGLDDSDKSQSRLGTRNKRPLLLHE
ncbi:unnamed protein product [Rangifer tarandus platyrhynchus]|uniref:Uncharacterized protein n=1 Tax=Rangifer tarandus platyrhynchus TaxID=3082113 RepID=A0AC59ZR99_RANTA